MKLKVLTITIVGLILISVSYLYLTRNSPLLYRSVDRASAKQSSFIIQNSFREPGPETTAEKILQAMKDGDCVTALTALEEDASSIAHTCEREGAYPLQNWSIADRRDFPNQVILVYELYRHDRSEIAADSSKAFSTLAWIDVKKVGDAWRALSYETYY